MRKSNKVIHSLLNNNNTNALRRSFHTRTLHPMRVVHPEQLDQVPSVSSETVEFVSPDEEGSLAANTRVNFYDIEEAFQRIRK